jgi:superfamily II DNA or RNA helicase
MSAAERKVSEAVLRVPDNQKRLIPAAGRYIGEGFDDQRLDTLFLTVPITWKGTLDQYVGRLRRQHNGKTEILVVDYVDEVVPVPARRAAKRRTGYRSLGCIVESSASTINLS